MLVVSQLKFSRADCPARTTIRLVAEEYIANMEERGLAAATIKKERWFLLDLASPLQNRPINEITPAELLYLLKPIEKSGRRETAQKMRGANLSICRALIFSIFVD